MTNSRPAVTRSGPAGAKYRRTLWYRQAKDNEARRDGARESERFIVPLKPGNPSRGDPVEGRRRLVVESMVGNSPRTSSLDPLSTLDHRIAWRLVNPL
jgi:hypothetical protein